jgi:hypothetical protein
MTRGRPGRGSSDNPSNRCTTNRDRHFDTVARDTPSWLATSPIVAPSAHCNTIRDRSANACAVFRRRDQPTSADRSSPDNTTGSSFGLGTAEAYPVTTNYRLTTLVAPVIGNSDGRRPGCKTSFPMTWSVKPSILTRDLMPWVLV